jgi:hypothetical protein
VLRLKAFITESVEIYQKNLQLTAPEWKQLLELRDLLKKTFEISQKLQLDELTPGYFFQKWSGL